MSMLLCPLSVALSVPGDPLPMASSVSGSAGWSRGVRTVQTKESFE